MAGKQKNGALRPEGVMDIICVKCTERTKIGI